MDGSLASGLRRGVHALVHGLGGGTVHLRLPAPPIAGDAGEELGLRAPEFLLQALAPTAVRRQAASTELLVPADVLEATLATRGQGAVNTAMQAVEAVVIDDEAYVPTGIEWIEAGGSVVLYRILLQPRGTEVV
jgi:hypothetical protein